MSQIILNRPVKSLRKNKKFKVYVRNPKTKRVNTVHFGDKRYEDYTQHKDRKRMRRFRKRHKCDPVSKLNKTKARYWSCQYLWNPKTSVRGSKNRRGTIRRL